MAKEPKIIYKLDDFEGCVVRYPENDWQNMHRKFKGKTEHATSPAESRVAAEAAMNGKEITKAQYDAF